MSATPIILAGLAAFLLIAAMISVADAQPPFTLVQYGASNDRELCLQNCRDWITPFAWGGRWGGAYSNQYARCVQNCESRFWNKFDQDMERLKEE